MLDFLRAVEKRDIEKIENGGISIYHPAFKLSPLVSTIKKPKERWQIQGPML